MSNSESLSKILDIKIYKLSNADMVYTDNDMVFTDNDIVDFNNDSKTASNSPMKRTPSYMKMLSSLFINKKDKCLCDEPKICEHCIKTKYDHFKSIKVHITKIKGVNSRYDEYFDAYCKYKKMTYILSKNKEIDYDKFQECLYLLFASPVSRDNDNYACYKKVIKKSEYDKYEIGNNEQAEWFIKFKLWEYYKDSYIDNDIIINIEKKMNNKKFICENENKCIYLDIFNREINNYIYNLISYTDYKTSLHVQIYHPILK